MTDRVDALSIARIVKQALDEDIGSGDITSMLVSNDFARAEVITREDMVLCGRDYVDQVFHAVDPQVQLFWYAQEGDVIKAQAILFSVEGAARSLLTAERTALNFLQTLSGVATVVRSYVKRLEGTQTILLDTRKTIPGLRLAEKYAVRCGGGHNHRLGLYDAYLIKENHIAAAGGILPVVKRARALHPHIFLEIEVENLEQLQEAIDSKVDRIMLDNFSLSDMKKAVILTAGRVPLEVSGNIHLDNIRTVAETGVDSISVGSLTKHVRAIDLSMRLIG